MFSDAAAEHIERLVAGWTQAQIARRAGLSVAKERGVVLNSRTEAAILTVR